MNKYLKGFVLPLTLVAAIGCGDDSGDIVVNNPGGGGGGSTGGGGGNDTACSFDGISDEFTSCLNTLDEEQLDIATWNIEFFPIRGNVTLSEVISIVENLNADVIAVQEINSINDFEVLGKSLEGWEARVIDLGGSLDLGYLFKSCEIESFDAPKAVLNGQVEPRPAVQTKIKHINGTEVTLFNIHLKARSGAENETRRRNASIALKDYIDTNLSQENVIVLGDWNDDIRSGSPFQNFLDDPENYKFADEEIATGPSENWSFPSFPSHIDHILISNELFDQVTNTSTVKLDDCVTGYATSVSDHRIVLSSFKAAM